MTTKEKIGAIAEILGLKKEETHLAQQKLADGLTIIEAEVFEAEQSVGVVSEEGITPLPVGEYEMEDGKMLVVVEEGVIAEIKDKEEETEEEEAPEAEKVEEEMSEEKPVKKIVESVSKETFYSKEDMEVKDAKIAELEAKITELSKVEEEETVELAQPIVHNPENTKKVDGFKYNSAGGDLMSKIIDKIK
jgi:hypothetical protein